MHFRTCNDHGHYKLKFHHYTEIFNPKAVENLLTWN